jgi:hypothetical protein
MNICKVSVNLAAVQDYITEVHTEKNQDSDFKVSKRFRVRGRVISMKNSVYIYQSVRWEVENYIPNFQREIHQGNCDDMMGKH